MNRMAEDKQGQPETGREIRSGKGVDVRPVVTLKPSEMPQPSGLVPQQPPAQGGSPRPKE
jgi:hypothetical protein